MTQLRLYRLTKSIFQSIAFLACIKSFMHENKAALLVFPCLFCYHPIRLISHEPFLQSSPLPCQANLPLIRIFIAYQFLYGSWLTSPMVTVEVLLKYIVGLLPARRRRSVMNWTRTTRFLPNTVPQLQLSNSIYLIKLVHKFPDSWHPDLIWEYRATQD